MPTHDMIIANAVGATFRADLNDALASLVANSSSATAPATMYAYQLWMDTSTSPAALKQRNSTNTAWEGVSVAPATAAAHAVRSDQLSADNTNFPIYTAPTTYATTLAAGSGTFTTATAAMSYLKTGKNVEVWFSITDTTNGTAASYTTLTLPFTADYHSAGSIHESGVTNSAGVCYVNATTSTLYIFKYDGTYLGGNGYFMRGHITLRTAL